MDTDRELLEAAAKAAGLTLGAWRDDYGAFMYRGVEPGKSWWNALTDDGDALRLAVKKRQHIVFTDKTVQVWESEDAPRALAVEWLHPDPYAATRRAIVRAAAALAKAEGQA